MNSANIKSIIMIKRAQELVISLEPASGTSITGDPSQFIALQTGVYFRHYEGRGSVSKAYHQGQFPRTLALEEDESQHAIAITWTHDPEQRRTKQSVEGVAHQLSSHRVRFGLVDEPARTPGIRLPLRV